MVKNEGDKLKRVIVSSPGKEYVSFWDKDAHHITEVADLEKAKLQHGILTTILENSGCEVVDVPELFGHPNSVFVRDAALCTPQGYLKLKMGLETRRGEEDWLEKALQAHGVPMAGILELPATAEGGDVILADHVAFVGHSHRTNEEGVHQLSAWLGYMGYKVRTVKVPDRYLHIGGAMSMIGPHRVLCCEGVFPEHFFDGYQTIVVPGDSFIHANVICIQDGEVIAERTNRETIAVLRQAGIEVHALDLSEFVKGAGGPSCLIMPVERVGKI
ncbi:MAG: amidinotransferase [Saprospirales bacterium]|nr:amidinotransferase [Saprospirales bacterium]MBK8492092.1 amidinotransferase [Saprospirales bacterium]